MKIADIIGSHLNIIQYHHYRFSSANKLKAIPRLTSAAYKDSSEILCVRDPSMYMILNTTTPETFIYLVINQHTRQIIRSKCHIPLSLKLEVFNYFIEPIALYSILVDILRESNSIKIHINFQILFDKMIDFGDTLIIRLLLQDKRFHPQFIHVKRALNQMNTGLIHLLINETIVDLTMEDNYLIRTACCLGISCVVERLLTSPLVDPGALQNEGLKNACLNGHVDVVKILLDDYRIDPTYGICCNESLVYGVVKVLLEDSRIDPTTNDYYAIFLAYSNEKYPVVEYLLNDARVDPFKVFERAMMNNQMGITDYLVNKEYIKKKLTRRWLCF
ncbi:hypothetical protein HDV01_005817 [Terramyces sp. JEL0728]|nr:hypothetical protein HDV01_005817 [Terramyces sp. JEL0728]